MREPADKEKVRERFQVPNSSNLPYVVERFGRRDTCMRRCLVGDGSILFRRTFYARTVAVFGFIVKASELHHQARTCNRGTACIFSWLLPSDTGYIRLHLSFLPRPALSKIVRETRTMGHVHCAQRFHSSSPSSHRQATKPPAPSIRYSGQILHNLHLGGGTPYQSNTRIDIPRIEGVLCVRKASCPEV